MPDPPATPLPPLADFVAASEAQQNAVLDALFEHSGALHALARPIVASASATPPLPLFASYAELVGLIGTGMDTLAESPNDEDARALDAMLGAHPRLGEARGGARSALSEMEQGAMAAASGVEDEERGEGPEREEAALAELNAQYEERFPGLRYVVFVNGRPRSVIMDDMKRRIARGDINAERKEAIKAMCDIATDRAKKLS